MPTLKPAFRASVAQLVEQQFCKLQVTGSSPVAGSTKSFRMSQDNLIKLECTECKKVNYHSSKNKKTIKGRLEIMKFCSAQCKKHTLHKETK